MGVNNGGVWKTDDYGRTWNPIFDDQPTGSIGTLAVAPSDPNTIYVGSGEGLQRPDLSTGDGIYRSRDAGKELDASRSSRNGCSKSAPKVFYVDPEEPKRLFVAVLGHPYGPNEERGVFRSTDGGETFQKVLYRRPGHRRYQPSRSIHPTLKPSTPTCGQPGKGPGKMANGKARTAVFTNRPMEETPGTNDAIKGLPRSSRTALAVSESPSHRANQICSLHLLMPSRAVVYIGPRILAIRGRLSTTNNASGGEAATSPR